MGAKNIKESEVSLQRKVHNLLSDPSLIFETESGKRLQVLSTGRHNIHEGPDFIEVALLLDGFVMVGDAEFHKNTSDWNKHRHSGNDNFSNVILHIVLNNDIVLDEEFETLTITDLPEVKNLEIPSAKETLNSIDELQHFALVRLLRKTAEAGKLIRKKGITPALIEYSSDFLSRYNSKRRRPVYDMDRFKEIIKNLENSSINDFLLDIEAGIAEQVPDRMIKIMKTKIHDEGAHLRRELMLNSVLPLALYLANENARIDLFLWYWSTPSLHTYGILTRKYKGLPQNFLWQQQGMLEYMRDHGKKQNVVSDALREYGFAEILSFYKLGSMPFDKKY